MKFLGIEVGRILKMEISIDGVKVNCSKEGKGDYIFILHGWGCNLTMYKMLVDTLKDYYTVVSFDFPGFGDSEEPPRGWTMADYTDFTIKLVEYFKCSTASFIGHSLGTRILIRMANRDNLSYEIKKMVFIAGAGILSKYADDYIADYNKFKAKKEKYIREGKTDKLNQLRKNAPLDYAYSSEVMCECYLSAVSDNLENMLPNVNVPTLLIWGEKDKLTPVSDAKKMEKLIPDAGLVLLKNAEHYPFFDQPYAFKCILESYFEISEPLVKQKRRRFKLF